MANNFAKNEEVAFDEAMIGFDAGLVVSRKVEVVAREGQMMERAGDIIWRPERYIVKSSDGMDQTGQFKQKTQRSVPATLGFSKAVTWLLDAKEMRDLMQEGRLKEAAETELASQVDLAVMDTICNQATICHTKATAAADFGDLAAMDSIFNRTGVTKAGREAGLSSPDYNALARDLANRATMNGKPSTAYEEGFVGRLAGFNTHKLDYANTCPAAAGGSGLTINTLVAGANYYTPRSTSTGANGERSNVDNRYQTITVSSTTSVVAGDRFTIADVLEVHQINKRSTGSLKQFVVISKLSATQLVISPPIVSAQGGTEAELQYQNCSVTGAASAAIVFLNVAAKPINPFWVKGAVELIPGRYAVPEGAGAAVMRAKTEQGIEVTMTKQFDIDTLKTKFRLDVFFGVVLLQPEMAGVELFLQA